MKRYKDPMIRQNNISLERQYRPTSETKLNVAYIRNLSRNIQLLHSIKKNNCSFLSSLVVRCSRTTVCFPAVSASSCSFPFTHNGQLYYQCATSIGSTSSCDIGCYLTGRVWARCMSDSRIGECSRSGVHIIARMAPTLYLTEYYTVLKFEVGVVQSDSKCTPAKCLV